ncbi:MAG: hypothetical protein JO057_19100 [Chloroflexi bacterium]|nr:hypothetical protein [Chloroflexota bacterium]
MRFISFFTRRVARPPQAPPLASYPPAVRRAFYWYDSLSDWQRIQYAGVAIVFLLACGGYMLGLGSAVVLARVESDDPALVATPTDIPTEIPTATDVPDTPTAVPTNTPVPSPTRPPTLAPTATPFTAPVISEPPAAPRDVPAVIAPPARSAPTVAVRPRNVETGSGAVATAPARAVVRTEAPEVVVPTSGSARDVTPVATVRSQPLVTSVPTVAGQPAPLLKPSGPTAVPTRAANAQPTPLLQPQPTTARTPASR